MKLLALIPLLFAASCASQRSSRLAVRPIPSPAVESTDAVRYAEVVHSYHVGRYIDPNDPTLMHAQHPVHRVEVSARWNLHPGPLLVANALQPPPDSAFAPAPTNDIVLAELSRQREVTERVMMEAVQLSSAYGELQKVLQDMMEVAKSQAGMRARITSAEQRFAEIEKELRRQAPSAFTNAAPASGIEPPMP